MDNVISQPPSVASQIDVEKKRLDELQRLAQISQARSGYMADKPYIPAGSPTTRSADIKQLATALSKAQSMLKFAVKDATNPHFKNKYADLASVWEACREALAANELSVTQLPSAEGPKVTLTTILMHSSGQFISSELTMTAAQNTPQGIGSVITYARRYALSSLVGIAQDDDDGNAGSRKA